MCYIKNTFIFSLIIVFLFACTNKQNPTTMQFTGQDGEVKLMVINPGHFHASLLQKNANSRVNDTIYVYAPEGEELNQYINAIEGFNTREDSPTAWQCYF